MLPSRQQSNNNQIHFKEDLVDQAIGSICTVPSKEDMVANDWNMISKKWHYRKKCIAIT